MDSFWDFFWFIISFFLLMAYLMVLFQIVIDLFRDHTVGGGMKAVWVVGLIFLPILTAVIYLIARGRRDGRARHGRSAARTEGRRTSTSARWRPSLLAGGRDRTGQVPAGLGRHQRRGVSTS